MKRYIARLTSEERQELERLVSVGKGAARKLMHARVLLQADAGADGPAWPDARIAEALGVHPNTVVGIRHRFVEESLDAALNRKKMDRPSRTPRLDGRGEARLIAKSDESGRGPHGQRPNADAHRRPLPRLGGRIDHEPHMQAVQRLSKRLVPGPDDDQHVLYARRDQALGGVANHRFALKVEKKLGLSHPAREARGKHDRGDHTRLSTKSPAEVNPRGPIESSPVTTWRPLPRWPACRRP